MPKRLAQGGLVAREFAMLRAHESQQPILGDPFGLPPRPALSTSACLTM